jgi:hypothetical protein
MNELLTSRDYLIIGFFGIWGLVGVSIIAMALFFWVRDRHADPPRPRGPRHRRRA